MTTLVKNQPAPAIITTSINGTTVDLNALRGKKVLIKFHRFSGCPVCQRQVHDLLKQQPALTASGIETILFVHSSREKIQSNFSEVAGLHIIADKPKKYYRLFGSQFSFIKMWVPATWGSIFISFFKGYFPQFNNFEGGVMGVPSDFLLDEKGVIKYLHYGKHYGDTWTVNDVLKLNKGC